MLCWLWLPLSPLLFPGPDDWTVHACMPLISVHIGRFATVGFTRQDLVEAFLPVSLHCQSLQMFLLPWIPTPPHLSHPTTLIPPPPHLSHPHHHTNSCANFRVPHIHDPVPQGQETNHREVWDDVGARIPGCFHSA